jgi:amino acid transporter
VALGFACAITLFSGWATFVHSPETGNFDWRTFIVSYLPIPIYVAMIVGYKVVMKSRTVRPGDADLYGGKARIDREEEEWVAEELRRKGGVFETRYQRLYRITLGNFF